MYQSPSFSLRWIGLHQKFTLHSSHVRCINIVTCFRGFRVKIVNFSSFFCLSILKSDLDTKKITPNLNVEVCPILVEVFGGGGKVRRRGGGGEDKWSASCSSWDSSSWHHHASYLINNF